LNPFFCSNVEANLPHEGKVVARGLARPVVKLLKSAGDEINHGWTPMNTDTFSASTGEKVAQPDEVSKIF